MCKISVLTFDKFQINSGEMLFEANSNKYLALIYFTPFSLDVFSVFEQHNTSFSYSQSGKQSLIWLITVSIPPICGWA